MTLIFAYLGGLLTLINPCVLPVLPLVLASALQAHRAGPLALAAGMSVSFVTLGLTIAAAGHALGLGESTLSQAGAVLMIAFGLILIMPGLNRGFATLTAGFAARADSTITAGPGGLAGQGLAGLLLGAVWSPCIGPTLGGAIGLASQGGSLMQAGAVMLAFAAGVSTVMLALAYGTRALLARHKNTLRGLATRAKPVMGVVLIATGAALLLRLPQMAEAWAITALPIWLQDLSLRF